jgi:hypothetical protein
MPTQNLEKSAPVAKKRARRSSTPPRSRSASPRHYIAPSRVYRARFPYIGQLSDRERVDQILAKMQAEHRWSIKDLLYHIVMEEPEKKWATSRKRRIDDLSKAIFDQPEVTTALFQATPQFRDQDMTTFTKIYRTELRELCSRSGFGKFDAEIDPKDIDIPHLVEQAKEAAPGLWSFLKTLVETGPTGGRLFANLDGALLMICIVLAHYSSPYNSNNFHMLLGMHLHSMGVKRRSINLLAGLGVTSNYQTILSHMNSVARIGEVRLAPILIQYKSI